MTSCDVAVIGAGTMGSFACSELARRGLQVIGLDRFTPPHDRGSHSGDTRVFRIAYAEHPDYVPLAQRSNDLWEQYSEHARTSLLTRCGMLSLGAEDTPLIDGILKSSASYGLPVVRYSSDEVSRLFPAFNPSEGQVGVFEPTAGWIDVSAAIGAAFSLARHFGAELRTESPALSWKAHRSHIEITTAGETILAENLVITAGAWAGELLSHIGLPLRVERKVLVWVDPLTPELFAPQSFPVFGVAERFFYGFPQTGPHGVKLAIHWEPGALVEDPSQPVPEATLAEAEPVLEIASRYLPDLAGPLPAALNRVRRLKTCLYTLTPDEHFIVDHYPDSPNVGVRCRVFRTRIQVRAGHRRSAGRARNTRPNQASIRLPSDREQIHRVAAESEAAPTQSENSGCRRKQVQPNATLPRGDLSPFRSGNPLSDAFWWTGSDCWHNIYDLRLIWS